MEFLSTQEFKEKIFDYENKKEWDFQGEKPVIIDFYADWCGPCKMLTPVLEEISKDYEGKIDIFKVDTEAEQELAMAFGISSIPSMLFIPKEGKPQMSVGFLPKPQIEKAISEVLNA